MDRDVIDLAILVVAVYAGVAGGIDGCGSEEVVSDDDVPALLSPVSLMFMSGPKLSVNSLFSITQLKL